MLLNVKTVFALGDGMRKVGSRIAGGNSAGASFFTRFAIGIGLIWLPLQVLAAPISTGQFHVDPQGAANYTLPLSVPAGVAGLEPRLSLSYNSRAGNGLLGVGWSLGGLSVIGRCPRTLAQDGVRGGVDYSTEDRYCLDGQRLMVTPATGVYGAHGPSYRTEQESFTSVTGYTQGAGSGRTVSGGAAYFIARTKSGLLIEYGNTADAQVMVLGKTMVRAWALNRMKDAAGNVLNVSYHSVDGTGQYYPAQIKYVGLTSAEVVVSFEYEQRPDPLAAYAAGSPVESKVRLKAIQVAQGGAVVRRYNLGYGGAALSSPLSYLASIQECAGTGACQPTLNFSWLSNASGASVWNSLPSFNLPEFLAGDGVQNNGTQLIDLNGDSLPDFVQSRWVNGATQYRKAWLNTGSGWSEFGAYVLPEYLAGDTVANNGTQFVDLNGDGLPDFVHARWVNSGTQYRNAWLNTGSGWNEARNFILPEYLAGDGVVNNGTQFVDLNGDGLPDFVHARWVNSGTQYRNAWLNTGSGWTEARSFILPEYLAGDGVDDNGSRFIDLNGDGLADFVRSRWVNNDTQYNNAWLNTGSGWVEVKSFVLPSYISGDGVKNNGTQFIDLNGDGLPDFVQSRWVNADTKYRHAWLNTGTCWVEAPNYTLPEYLAGDGVENNGTQFVDLNGDGLADFVHARWVNSNTQYRNAWLNTGSGWVEARNYVLPEYLAGDGVKNNGTALVDLDGNGIPDMVHARWVNSTTRYRNVWLNQSNKVLITGVKVDSTPLVDFTYYHLPQSGGIYYWREVIPAFPRVSPMPPVPIVVGTKAGVGSGATRQVTYQYGRFQLEAGLTGRGFLGFQWMQTIDESTGLRSRTTYRQNFPFIGMVEKSTQGVAGSSDNLSQTTYVHGCYDFDGTVDCQPAAGKRYFVYQAAMDEKAWDLKGVALPGKRTETTYDCASAPVKCFGNAKKVTITALDTGGNPTAYVKETVSDFLDDEANWIVGRLLRSQVMSKTP